MKVTFRYFFRKYWLDYTWGILTLLATNVLAASIPWRIKDVMDALSANRPEATPRILVLIAGTILVMFVVRVLSRYFLIGLGRKIEFETRDRMYRHLLTMPRSYYDAQQTGELMSRLTNDLTALRMLLGGGVMLMANVIFSYLTVLPLMAILSWKLTLVAFILYPAVVTLMRAISGRVKRFAHAVQERLADLTALAQENFSGMAVIQSFAKEPEESARFDDAALAYFEANTRLVRARSLLYVLIAMVSGLSILAVLGEGGREVILGGLSLSGLTAFLLYLERLSWPTVSFGWILSTFQQGLAAKERINQVFEARPTITDSHADFTLTEVPEGAIAAKNLWFRYENPYLPSEEQSSPRPWVLQNIDFAIPPGALAAIVGPIGSGKTTLLNLLARLYDPPPETLWITGRPIEQYPLLVLRQAVTLMPQNSFLFSTTIQTNIAYVNPEMRFEHIAEAAQMAQIHEEILQLPKAYETVVGERGITLSGGQRQRSAMARTLLVDPKILLLDDPFSNVDMETEAEIIAALQARRARYRRTTIFSSHRLAFVQQADMILVLTESGELEAVGTHTELMQASPMYQALNARSHQELQAS